MNSSSSMAVASEPQGAYHSAAIVLGAGGDLHACQVPSTLSRDGELLKDNDQTYYSSSVSNGSRKGLVGWIASAVKKQVSFH